MNFSSYDYPGNHSKVKMAVMLLKLTIKVYLVESFNDKILPISFDCKIRFWNHTDVG